MAFEHAPLTEADLGPIAARMVGESAPPKMRKLVAQGAAPLPPRDMLVALYQIWVTEPATDTGELAGRTITTLPEATLTGALNNPGLPAGVLDLLGRKLLRNAEVLDAVVRHANIDDESLVGIARICPAIVCDTIARAEAKWLRSPQIIAALYQNRHCRMSLIHRMLEMADREGVDVRMAGIEEIRAAMEQESQSEDAPSDEERDAMFAAAMTGEEFGEDEFGEDPLGDDDGFFDGSIDDELDLPGMEGLDIGGEDLIAAGKASKDEKQEPERISRLQQIMNMRPPEKVRTALLGDKSDRAMLIRDSNKVVSMSAVKSPKVTDGEACSWAANRSLSPDIIRYIASKREWIKLYTVKLNLVMNPKTPMARSMSLLAYLNRSDLAKVARSKGIPSSLAKAAKRKIDGGR